MLENSMVCYTEEQHEQVWGEPGKSCEELEFEFYE
jgi:hypothetical protein